MMGTAFCIRDLASYNVCTRDKEGDLWAWTIGKLERRQRQQRG